MRTVAVVAAMVVLLMGLTWLFQRKLTYFPGGEPPPVGEVLPGGESVTLRTSDDLVLDAWFVEAGPTTVLVFPGNGGNRAGRAPLARSLAEQGLSVLLVEYRGYGGNPGSPSEEGLRHDALAALSWAEQRLGGGPLVYFGESIGSGVATWLATDTPPAALVLRSPIPSLGAVAREHYGPVPDAFLRDRYDVGTMIGEVEAPLLVVLGGADRIVPPALSRRVVDAAGGPVEVVTVAGAGHNDLALLDGERFIRAVIDFLDVHVPAPPDR